MVKIESPAVAIARAHVEAWSNHDFDAARGSLASDVEVSASTTQQYPPPTKLSGVDDYMSGLTQFAQGVVPGSARRCTSHCDNQSLRQPRHQAHR